MKLPTGYFLYDLLVIVFEGRIHKMWEVVPHHIAVGGSCGGF